MGKGHREVYSRWLFTFRRVLEADGGKNILVKIGR